MDLSRRVAFKDITEELGRDRYVVGSSFIYSHSNYAIMNRELGISGINKCKSEYYYRVLNEILNK